VGGEGERNEVAANEMDLCIAVSLVGCDRGVFTDVSFATTVSGLR
jgi:hypothetical protein